MSKLRNVLENNFQHEMPNLKDPAYKKIIIDKLESDIRQEIILEEAERIAEAKEKEQTLRNIERIRDNFWTIVVIGILVGVAGNQITELIAFGKCGLPIGWTVLLAVLLIGIMYFCFWTKYLKQASIEIRRFKDENK